MHEALTTDRSACTSHGAVAVPSNATPVAGVQTERAVVDLTIDLNAIVARKRAAGVQRAAAPMVGAYMPADGWTGGEYATPAMVARDEQTVRDQRADAAYGGYDAGVSW